MIIKNDELGERISSKKMTEIRKDHQKNPEKEYEKGMDGAVFTAGFQFRLSFHLITLLCMYSGL